MSTSAPTNSSIDGIPFKLVSAAPVIERRTASVQFERSPSKSFGVARGQRGVEITAKFYSQSNLDLFMSLMDGLTDAPVFFDSRQRPAYTGYYIPGDIHGSDKTYSSTNVEMSFTLWEAATTMVSIYDTIASQNKPTSEGLLEYIGATVASSPRVARLSSTSSAQSVVSTFTGTDTTPAFDTTAWTTGDVFKATGWLTLTGFSDLSANHLMGIRFGDSTVDFTKTATARNQIIIGADSTGALFLVCANAAAVTSTAIGVTAVSGTRLKFRVTWTVGTGVTVVINDATSLTMTTTNPTLVNVSHFGWGTTGSASKIVESQRTAWMWIPVA